MTTALVVKNLYKVFGRKSRETIQRLKSGASREEVSNLGTAAVIDASFSVKKGEIFVIMGLSGSGKSTIIRMLNRLLDPSEGEIILGEQNISELSERELRKVRQEKISMVFQHFALLPHRTVLDNAAYALEIQGMPKAERYEIAKEILQVVGLESWQDHYPDALSGGMKQRVGLARALAAQTEILLMDEAFSALDPLIRHEMQEQLLSLQAKLQKTIIFITHDLNEAMFLGDRIAVMRSGRIVQIGTPEDILTDPANDYVAQFVQDVDRARVLTAESVMERPQQVANLTAGPRAALRTMRDLQTSALFVLDRDRRLVGIVRDKAVLRLVKQGQREFGEALSQDFSQVTLGTQLSEMIPTSVESPVPLAVVDENGRLVGVVPRITLLAALGNVDSSNGNTDEIDIIGPPATVLEAEITQTLEDTASIEIISDAAVEGDTQSQGGQQ
ncbi:MAG: glycine betaine/L-proline ABC transporter ATP-binding protein [Microbacteriaceae bacterium]